MRRSPLGAGIIYMVLGGLFAFFAIQNVNQDGWGLFSYLLVILATFDFGSGLKMIGFHFMAKKRENQNPK